MTEAVDIYKLELHQEKRVKGALYVRRVPGGWIYTEYDDDYKFICSNFVPFNDEYMSGDLK